MKNKVEIYTDGSSLGNPGKGGWGIAVVSNNKIIREIGGFDKDTTNNKMEIRAVIESLKYIIKNNELKNSDLIIHTDSAYVLGGITNWIFGWEKNGWKTSKKEPVLNKELWIELISLVRDYKEIIKWEKVKGHSGHIYNDLADEIATNCALKQKTH